MKKRKILSAISLAIDFILLVSVITILAIMIDFYPAEAIFVLAIVIVLGYLLHDLDRSLGVLTGEEGPRHHHPHRPECECCKEEKTETKKEDELEGFKIDINKETQEMTLHYEEDGKTYDRVLNLKEEVMKKPRKPRAKKTEEVKKDEE